MKRTIGLVAAALAATVLACGADERIIDTNGEEILPPEKTYEEAGLLDPGVADAANLLTAPHIQDGVTPEWSYATDNGGMLARPTEAFGGGITIQRDNSVRRQELLSCTDDGECDRTVVYVRMNGEVIGDDEAEAMGLPLDEQPPSHGFVHSEPRDYWATEDVGIAATPGGARTTPVTLPNSPFAACDNIHDICQIGFEPWCNGGVGKVSPGGITETSGGCRGTTRKNGGPGNIRPDNANVRISVWSGTVNSCADTTWPSFPELTYVVNRINNNDLVLPPPFQFTKAGCNSNGLPPGYVVCDDGIGICPAADYVTYGSLVDVLVQNGVLSDVSQTHTCVEARNAQEGYNRANARTLGCTTAILEREDRLDTNSPPKIRSWNNGWTNTFYWTARGVILYIDPAAITWHATRPSSVLDRGGLNQATRESFTKIHVIAHELGHSVGLTHAFIGADGSPRWVPHSRLPNAMTPNANLTPHSAMARSVPAAPYTVAKWSSGLMPNLVGMDLNSGGSGNNEAWKLSNHFRTVNDGFVSYPTNTFAPPLSETNNEM